VTRKEPPSAYRKMTKTRSRSQKSSTRKRKQPGNSRSRPVKRRKTQSSASIDPSRYPQALARYKEITTELKKLYDEFRRRMKYGEKCERKLRKRSGNVNKLKKGFRETKDARFRVGQQLKDEQQVQEQLRKSNSALVAEMQQNTETHKKKLGRLDKEGKRFKQQIPVAKIYDPNKLGAQLRGCGLILQKILGMNEAIVFIPPVDTKRYPTYASMIKRPMWLEKVQTNLYKGQYKTTKEFRTDVMQVWKNAKTYNPPHNIVHNWAKMLQKLFEDEMEAQFTPGRNKSRGAAPPPTKFTDKSKTQPTNSLHAVTKPVRNHNPKVPKKIKPKKRRPLTEQEVDQIERGFEELNEDQQDHLLRVSGNDAADSDVIELNISDLSEETQFKMYDYVVNQLGLGKTKENVQTENSPTPMAPKSEVPPLSPTNGPELNIRTLHEEHFPTAENTADIVEQDSEDEKSKEADFQESDSEDSDKIPTNPFASTNFPKSPPSKTPAPLKKPAFPQKTGNLAKPTLPLTKKNAILPIANKSAWQVKSKVNLTLEKEKKEQYFKKFNRTSESESQSVHSGEGKGMKELGVKVGIVPPKVNVPVPVPLQAPPQQTVPKINQNEQRDMMSELEDLL